MTTAKATIAAPFSGTVSGNRTQDYIEQLDVEIFGNEGRIRLPRITLPPIRGGKGGWFELGDLELSERAITARAKINFVNKPKVYIDRMTGTISINGMNGNYIGRCEAVEADTKRRF